MARPEKVFKVGGCTASVFENSVNGLNGNATIKSVTLQRAYKDKDGNFQHTNSFKLNDIPSGPRPGESIRLVGTKRCQAPFPMYHEGS